VAPPGYLANQGKNDPLPDLGCLDQKNSELSMISYNKRKYRNRKLKQYIIVIAAALIMGVVASLIARFLDTPHSVYYPHDEERVKKLIE